MITGILKGILKIIVGVVKFLFGFAGGYSANLDRYHSKGLFGKILKLVFLILFAVAVLVLEKFAISKYSENILVAILLTILFVSFAFAVLKTVFIHIFIGFGSARRSRKEEKDERKLLASAGVDVDKLEESKAEGEEANNKPIIKNRHKWFDVLFSVLNIFILVGFVFGVVYVLGL